MVTKGSLYRHFKGGIYKVICVGYHSETQEKMVVYKDIETDKVCIRPYDMFVSDVDHKKYPDVKQKKRFERIKKRIKSYSNDCCLYIPDDEDLNDDIDESSYLQGLKDGKEFNT